MTTNTGLFNKITRNSLHLVKGVSAYGIASLRYASNTLDVIDESWASYDSFYSDIRGKKIKDLYKTSLIKGDGWSKSTKEFFTLEDED